MPCPFRRSVWPSVVPSGMSMSSVLPSGKVTRCFAAAGGRRERHTQAVGHRHAAHVEPVAAGAKRKAARARAGPAASRAAEHVGEDVAHVDKGLLAARPLILGAAEAAGMVAIEAARRRLLAGGVDLAGIEAAALLGIRQDVVGLRDLLELGLGRLVAWVEVGMMLLGELAERLADVVVRGGPRYTKDGIGISHNPSNVMSIQAVASPRRPTASTNSRYFTLSTDNSRPQLTRSLHGSLSLPRPETTATTVPTSIRPVMANQPPTPSAAATAKAYIRFMPRFMPYFSL